MVVVVVVGFLEDVVNLLIEFLVLFGFVVFVFVLYLVCVLWWFVVSVL